MVIGQLSSTFKKVRKILFWDDRIIWKCIADDSTNKTRIKQRNWLSIMINHKLEKSIARKWRRVKNKADEYLVVSYLIFMEVYTLELYTLFEKSIAEGIDTRRGMEGNKKQGWKRLQSRFDVVVIIQGCRGILNVWRSYTSIRFFLFFFFIPLILGSDGPGYNDTERNMRALARYRRVRNMNQFTTRRYPNPRTRKSKRVYFRELESSVIRVFQSGEKRIFIPPYFHPFPLFPLTCTFSFITRDIFSEILIRSSFFLLLLFETEE